MPTNFEFFNSVFGYFPERKLFPIVSLSVPFLTYFHKWFAIGIASPFIFKLTYFHIERKRKYFEFVQSKSLAMWIFFPKKCHLLFVHFLFIMKMPSRSIKKEGELPTSNHIKCKHLLLVYARIGEKCGIYNGRKSKKPKKKTCDRWDCHETFTFEVDEDRSLALHQWIFNYFVLLLCGVIHNPYTIYSKEISISTFSTQKKNEKEAATTTLPEIVLFISQIDMASEE